MDGGEDIRDADGASGDFGTACKYIDHAVVVRRGSNDDGHGQIARYQPVVKSILAGCSIHLPEGRPMIEVLWIASTKSAHSRVQKRRPALKKNTNTTQRRKETELAKTG